MKQFIVLLAVLPLLLLFCLQTTLDQINTRKLGLVADAVYNAKEEAREVGYFSEEIKEKLIDKVVSIVGCKRSDVVINATDESDVKYRVDSASDGKTGDSFIKYTVLVPIGKMMEGASIFGIDEKDNVYMFGVDSYAASERLK